jgi:hypothetical protein
MMNKLDRIIIILTGLLLACVFLYSCNHAKNKNENLLKENVRISPLDTILGEKVLNTETGEKRVDNFKSLLNIKKQELQFESSLYSIKKINSNHFILSQKKNYSEARNFNILIKTDDSIVKSYFVINDFQISDIKQDSTNWILLLSDFYQTNTYWKSRQQIKIIKLDSNFKQLWDFSKNSSTPLSGQSLKVNTDNYSFNVEVIIGCHICYTLAQILLSKDGEFLSVKSIGKQNAEALSEKELNLIFYEK